MPGAPNTIPEDYEILTTVDSSGSVGEYIARHKPKDALVRLKVFDFSQASGATTRRQLREYLRCDITFMEELDLAGVIRIFDYSDTKNLFWTATQPAKIDKLSKCFDFLKTQSFQFREGLVRQFLTTLQRIHNGGVVHRNLSSDAVFLGSELEIYVGEFGSACYLTDQPTTRGDTSSVTTMGYQPPEVQNAETFTCETSCDIFSAGLLVFEILSASVLPKDNPSEVYRVFRARLDEKAVKDVIGTNTAGVILKAADPSPEKRWSTAEHFLNALENSLQVKAPPSSISVGPASTMTITQPAEPSETAPAETRAGMLEEVSQPTGAPAEAAEVITPLDPAHEIWNGRYEILDRIGEGGQAIVYKAYDHLTNEEIAIKTIWSRHREDRSAINRLKQGAMVARSLTHRHIIRTYSVEQRIDADDLGKYVFISMELIRSQLELGDVIEARRTAGQKFRLDEVLHVIRQLLDALAYAHEHTIHRDIKPGNIMLVPREEQAEVDTSDLTKFDIRLIDFGIAKVLSQKHIDVTGKGFRSAHYGAPELADAKTGVDARADIFSAGVIMYQMLAKAIPRKGSPPANKVNKDVPAALAKVIDRAISADREKRFRTASEFAKEIDRAVSRFRWVRQVAKMAAVLLAAACITAAVKYFLPEPDYVPLQQGMEILTGRVPVKQIATLAGGAVVRYSDVEGYDSYDSLRQTALEGLKTAEELGTDKFKRSYPPWKKQEEVWTEIEPAVEKIERIAQDQREYDRRKDIGIADHLLKLEPSSKIVSEVKDKTQRAEALLEARPLSVDVLDMCVNAYDLGARVYQNIEILADGSDAPDTAVTINDKLKKVEELRDNLIHIHSSLETVEPLKMSGFQERSVKCLQKADRCYQSFELGEAERYFGLLNQVCGTMAYVQDQIDFKRSDISLVGSRLIELCYEDVGTFENYPLWQQKLEQVHKKKDILSGYKSIYALVSENPEGIPLSVYDLVASARNSCEQGDLDSAGAHLSAAREEYKRYMRQRINELRSDCDSLLTFPFVSTDSVQDFKKRLEGLSENIDEPRWPQPDFVQEYKHCWQDVTSEKGAVRKQLSQRARDLRTRIVNSGKEVEQQSFFWNSQLIDKYAAVARRYDTNDVEASIENWKHVEDLSRLSAVLDQMRRMNSYLDKMLTRKKELDVLASDIDEAISFCERFKGISSEERENYKRWGSQLKELRTELAASRDNTYLIDRNEEMFTGDLETIRSVFSEIRAKLPYHRKRVIELINKARSLEKNAGYLTGLQQNWSDVLGESSAFQGRTDFSEVRSYLEGIKEDVDNWPPESFKDRLRDKCKVLSEGLYEQRGAAGLIVSAVLDEKSRLIEGIQSFERKVNEILNDEDIRELDELAAVDTREVLLKFRQLPTVLGAGKDKFSNFVLDTLELWEDIMPENGAVDFEVDTWLEKYNAKENQLDIHISQLQAIEARLLVFRETRQMLAQQSSMETAYYHGLKDFTVRLIDYSDVGDKIKVIEADSVVIRMCHFLEEMKDATLPRLEDLKASFAQISGGLSRLRTLKLNSLSEAKDFNRERKLLLSSVATVRQDLARLERTNLEVACRQSIALAVDEIANTIGGANQTGRVIELTSSLWGFFPYYKDWDEWKDFLKLFHVVVSADDVWLTSSELLRPADERGTPLSLVAIAADPANVFNTDSKNSVSFGWPRYVSHRKDPTVTLVFIPGEASGGIGPVYMAVREINNSQYKLFMQSTGAKSITKLTGWSCFGDESGKAVISQAQGQFPPSRITMDESTGIFAIDEQFGDAPVTWVRYYGAQAYARWLGAELPTVIQFVHAARAGMAAVYPWGDDLSDAASYAHVRSAAWQDAARRYNATRDNPVEIAYPPVGAVKDFLSGKALEPAKIAHTHSNDYPVWPCFTKDNKPNKWGLYDMIGNVWEWCRDTEDNSKPVVCGGSCLSPPEYIAPEAKYEFDAQACDVGFRVVIAAK